MREKKKLGAKGEGIALSLLKQKGYKIIARNYHTKFGELDIVAEENGTLVFVEVKTRTSRRFGTPEEAISSKKLKSIEKVGQIFRSNNQGLPDAERIDIVAIELDKEGRTIRKELIENA